MPKLTIQNVDCEIPPVGKVWNFYTGELERRSILKRSQDPEEQYWQRTSLPDGWDRKRAAEKERQEREPDFVNIELEEFRRQEWDRRLNGVWFMNNGKPEYLTPLHYFYLNWWKIDIGYPHFRKSDWEYFIFLDQVIKDPNCAGMIEVTRRRQGKTARSGAFLYEYTSRTNNAYAGIQSKSDDDARDSVYNKFVIEPFKHLPDFFRPNYDTAKGMTPADKLRFYNPTLRGAKAESNINDPELESTIDYKPAKDKAYDGTKKHRYVSDESAKLEPQHDIYERAAVMKHCLENDNHIIGKSIYTSTVEDMGGVDENGKELRKSGVRFKKLWLDSDQRYRNENGRTTSWLYQFFMPAYKAVYFDKYGYPDEKTAKEFFINERKSLEHDPRALNSYIRKNPFTPEEAFRVDSDACLYNAMNLNDRLDFFSYAAEDTLYDRGNLVELPDGSIDFVISPNGRFKIHELPDQGLANRVRKRGSSYQPMNTGTYVIGIDPYSHSKVNFGTGSKGAAYVYKRPSISDPDNTAKFVAQYIFRPQTVRMFYEDMRKLCHLYGAPMLFENQKQGIKEYFELKEYSKFLIWLPKAKQAGIPASKPSHQELAEATELYIEDHCHKVPFRELIDDWLMFDVNDTEKYDAAMASGWTLVADKILSKRFVRNSDTSNLHNSRMFKKVKL